MENVQRHEHNGTDSPQISIKDLLETPASAITAVTGTADGTYSANEQTLINDLKTAVNALITTLQTLNLTK